ncbi:TIGR02281 family clan AA aspartic protease [Methylococcus sp. EFPC2]|uniref:retropepsin-like aspartic protease family protein n=1 Tax=Methylococcus sp. EFPC2 TaxID=2812648 RepID=UPI0019675797|nr:retropepsin-like aspartic protease [Methylococcus sp. EFPC2]QSA96313.1 retroviral-like aspartic protease family protein [Methylococcus sp. EFPC2]
MGTPNRPQPSSGQGKTSFDYQRIASRHRPPQPALTLSKALLWVLVAVVAVIGISRLCAPPKPAPPAPTASEAPSDPADTRAELPEMKAIPLRPTEAAPTPRFVPPAPVEPEMAPPPPPTVVREVLARDRSGNYFTQGLINGKSVRMMADTGASTVVIPEKIARRIGLKSGRPVTVKTAGGIVQAYETALDTLTLGRIEIRQVAAMINPAMQDDFALLGMNALSLLQFSQENGTLVLSYDPAKAGNTAEENQPEPDVSFRKSVKECMGDSKVIDQKTLNCLKGE